MARGTRISSSAKQREAGKATPRRRRGANPPAPTPKDGKLPSLTMLRTSERGTLKRCEFLWDLTYNKRVKPMTEMPALRFGGLAHQALAAWYPVGTKRGTHPAKAFKKFYDEDLKRNNELFGMRLEEEERWVNAEELGVAMMNNYVDEYGTDPDWEVLATEMPFQTVVMHPETGKPWFVYTGIVDGVWKYRPTRELWIPDHKTTAGIHKNLRFLQMDDQAGSYWSFGVQFLVHNNFLRSNQQLNGMLYNFLRKALPDERPSKIVNGTRMYLNKDETVSKRQPPPYFKREIILRDEFDRNQAVRRAMIDFTRAQMLREGKLEISKNPGMFTCPGCPMLDVCELHETGHDWQAFVEQTTKPWDPYAEHEVYDGR